jgi:CxxC motif-containing protein (DUF1111 family)
MMRSLKLSIIACAAFAFVALFFQMGETRAFQNRAITKSVASEAPSGFDDKTNGFVTQAVFNVGMGAFNKHYFERDGLGPVFNLQTCLRCHQFPTIGGAGLITVIRAGVFDGKKFIAPAGGTLIHTSGVPATLVEQLLPEFNVVSKRTATSILGAGFIEALADDTLRAIASQQPKKSQGRIKGQALEVPVLESPGSKRLGRFGWKNSHASLLSFTGEALRNEIGITNPLYPTENSFNGKSVADYDKAPDPEVDFTRLDSISNFLRATKAPARIAELADTPEAQAGEKIFASVGCAICHVPTLKTMPVGAITNGGRLTINEALGDKIIHPFSDFLLHDVGTGDGIVENGSQDTRNKIRTAPLWGLGARVKRLGDNLALMHDGGSPTVEKAILRHAGEASLVMDAYQKLTGENKRLLLAYLSSL